MTDSYSYSSGWFSGSRFLSEPSEDTSGNYRFTDDEDDVLSSIRSMAAYSRKESDSSKKSKHSKPSKSSRQSTMRKDERDDYSGRFFRNAALGEREDPPIMVASPAVHSKHSAAKSDASPIPRDLVIKSRKSNSSQSRKSMSSRSNSSIKSKSTSNTNKNDLEYWSALSVRAAMAVLTAGGSENIAQEASNVVLATGRNSKGKQIDNKTLMFLSTKLALVVLEAGGNEKVASAVSSAVMASDKDDGINEDDSVKIQGSDSLSGSFHNHSKQHSKAKVKAESPSVTSSMAAKRRQLKEKEIEMEEKMKALEQAQRRNMQKEEDIKEKIAALRRKDEEEVVAQQQQRLKDLEKQLDGRKRELKIQEEDRVRKQKDIEQKNVAITEKELDANARLLVARRKKLKEKEDEIQLKLKMLEINKKEVEAMTTNFSEREREINNKLEAIRIGEEERLKKEREIEQKVKYFAHKEQEIFERLSAIEAASVARREKEREVKARVVDFAQREKEIADRLAAIDAASVARRKREKEIEDKIIDVVQREQKIDERLVLIESASLLGDNELEMEEKLRLTELDKKELLIREKNNALEEAMQLNIQRENEIREKMAALDAATDALLERANAVQAMRDSGGGNAPAKADVSKQNIPETKEEDWCPETKDLKPIAPETKVENPPQNSTGLGFFQKYTNSISQAFDNSIAKAFDNLSCSKSGSEDYSSKQDVTFAPGTFSDDEYDSPVHKGPKNYPTSNFFNFFEPHLSKSLPESQQFQQEYNGSLDSTFSEGTDSFKQQYNTPSKAINDSLNTALKASMQLYSPVVNSPLVTSPLGSDIERPRPKPALKMVSADPQRGKPPTALQKESQKNGGLKNKLKSVFRKKKTSPGQGSNGYQVTYAM